MNKVTTTSLGTGQQRPHSTVLHDCREDDVLPDSLSDAVQQVSLDNNTALG